jgi:hypothetical protein
MASTSIDRISGLSTSEALKSPCKVAAVANITLYGEQVVQGVSCLAGDRVLVTAQTSGIDNGIYVVSASAWTRAKDWNGARDIVQYTQVFAGAGDSYSEGIWRVGTSNPITIGSTSIAFEKDTSLSSVSVDNVDGIATVAITNSYNDLDDLPVIVGTGDMQASVYDPANKEEQVITISDIGVLAALDSVGTTEIDDSSVTYAKMQNVSANKVLGSVAGGIVSELSATTSGLALLSGANAAAQRSSLGLGTIATQSASAVAITGGTITGLGLPSGISDVATKEYVDSVAATSTLPLTPVRAASTANGTLATSFENGDVMDGVTLATNDRILLKDQTSGQYNGVYIVQASGAPVRATDANTGAELIGAPIFVLEGTVNAQTVWTCITTPITIDTTPIVFARGGNSLSKVQSTKLDAIVIWTPSDRTGVSDMSAELEAYVAANQGYLIRVAENSTIRLNDAFASDTTNSFLIDFGRCTIAYDNTATAALKMVNALGSDKTVTTLAVETLNADAVCTTAVLSSSSGGLRFDWYALCSSDINPARDDATDGYFGEIAQIVTNETGNKLTFARKLNKHSKYTTGIKVAKLNASRKVFITGGIFKANGTAEDLAITDRGAAIWVEGFVRPELYNITFKSPWQTGIHLQATAQATVDGMRFFDIGNLASVNGYTYGITLYGMNDAPSITNTTTSNGRHAAVTTDGNQGSTSTKNKGITTNATIDGVVAHNAFGDPVDTHHEGDNIVIRNVVAMYGASDDVAITSTDTLSGLGIQVRCTNVTLENIFIYGSTGGIRVTNVNHGGDDIVTLKNINIRNLTNKTSSSGGIGINILDCDSTAEARQIIMDGVSFDGVQTCVYLGNYSKISYTNTRARNFKTFMRGNAATEAINGGGLFLDYRNSNQVAPYYVVDSWTSNDGLIAANTHIMLEAPRIIKGDAANKPSAVFNQKADNGVARNVFSPNPIEYNPSGVTRTTILSAGSTFVTVSVTGLATQALEAASNLSDVASASVAFGNISPLTTKGDVLIRSSSGNTRLPVGTDGYALVADSTLPAGLKWAEVSGGGAITSFYGLSELTSTSVGTGFKRTFTLEGKDRLSIYQATSTVANQIAAFDVERSATYNGANASTSWINYGILAKTTAADLCNTAECALAGEMNNYSILTNAKNAGVLAVGNNYAAGATWGLQAKARDFSTALAVPISLYNEVGVYANKNHTLSNMIGLYVTGGKSTSGGAIPKFFAGVLVDSESKSNSNATWSNGLVIGDYSVRGTPLTCETGIRVHTTFSGGYGVRDDGSKAVGFYADGTYSAAAFRMGQGQKISWDDADAVQTYYDGTVIRSNMGLRISAVSTNGAYFTGNGGAPLYGIDFGSQAFTGGFVLRSAAFDLKDNGLLCFKKTAVFSAAAGAAAARYLRVTDDSGGSPVTYKIALFADS